MLLALDKVSRFYGQRLVFKDVSLAVRPGTVTLLAGANGAGKSTLLKIMAGLLRPSAGTVTWGGPASSSGSIVSETYSGTISETASETTSGKSAGTNDGVPLIGYLGHQTFLYPELSAAENLRFWSAMHQRKLSKHDLADILERVELSPFAEEKAGGFSRGMAQRLNLARVFLLRPDILLLDEPGTGLDTRSTAVLQREIAGAKTAGAGIVWITHSLSEDRGRADMLAVLDNKALRFYGPATDYRENTSRPAENKGASPRFACGGEPC